MRTDWITVLSLMAAASMPAIVPAQDAEHYVSPWRTPWTYEQAGNWGQLDPSYALCGVGKKQSPIDIRDVQKAALPALVFEYMRGPLKRVINNGHTIRVNYHDAPGTGDSLIVGGKRYQLTQFHFHRPSEEDVDGKSFAMEAHLMHQASDGTVVGVTVFLKAGRANSTVQKIWMHMPKTEGQEEVSGVEINPADLLPHDPGYYMYMGSQTAPPCSEGITWFVLKTPIEVSAEQISAFARLYPRDIRPIQPLNGRIVKGSQ
jgi:carbonic anhydrase